MDRAESGNGCSGPQITHKPRERLTPTHHAHVLQRPFRQHRRDRHPRQPLQPSGHDEAPPLPRPPQEDRRRRHCVAMLVYTGSLVVFPWLIALAFAAVVDGELGRLTWILLAMGINALAGWAFNYVQLVLMARVGQNVLYNLRMDLFRHLQGLSLSFYDRNEVGRIMSRMQNDIIQLQEFLTTGILVFGDMLVLGGIIGAMLLMDVQLALVTLAVLPTPLPPPLLLAAVRPTRLPPGPQGHRRRQRFPPGEHRRHPGRPEHGQRGHQPPEVQPTQWPKPRTPASTPAGSPPASSPSSRLSAPWPSLWSSSTAAASPSAATCPPRS